MTRDRLTKVVRVCVVRGYYKKRRLILITINMTRLRRRGRDVVLCARELIRIVELTAMSSWFGARRRAHRD